MRITGFTLLLIAGVVISSCSREKPVPDGFVCVKPLARAPLERARLDLSSYQETQAGSGHYVPKGWIAVPTGDFKGCYVPTNEHPMTTIHPPL